MTLSRISPGPRPLVPVPPVRWGPVSVSVQPRAPGGILPGRLPVAIPAVRWHAPPPQTERPPAPLPPSAAAAQPQRQGTAPIQRRVVGPVVQPLAAFAGTTLAIGLTAL